MIAVQYIVSTAMLLFVSFRPRRPGHAALTWGLLCSAVAAYALKKDEDFATLWGLGTAIAGILLAFGLATRLASTFRGDWRLPAALADPLLAARPVALLWLLTALLKAGGGGVVSLGLVGILFTVWAALLPHRRTNAFYLRAYANDDDSGRLRRALARWLGPGFRLSGIRNPARRTSFLTRVALVSVMMFRYRFTGFGDLEGRPETWAAQLWRSLAGARAVFIDVTDVSDAVLLEIRLAQRCVGLSRVLFIGSPARTHEQWVASIISGLDPPPTAAVHLAIWDWDKNRKGPGFDAAVGSFVAQLPPKPAGFAVTAEPLIYWYLPNLNDLMKDLVIDLIQFILAVALLLLMSMGYVLLQLWRES